MKSIEIGYRHPAIQQYLETKKGNKKDHFAIESIWSYEKIISTNLKIEDLFYAPECIKDDFQKEVLSVRNLPHLAYQFDLKWGFLISTETYLKRSECFQNL
ncbi:MAG: hypothetical protein JXR88_10000 [Clostridia bacterium]|nr:hypothetical protein [Clostridia bacterium]